MSLAWLAIPLPVSVWAGFEYERTETWSDGSRPLAPSVAKEKVRIWASEEGWERETIRQREGGRSENRIRRSDGLKSIALNDPVPGRITIERPGEDLAELYVLTGIVVRPARRVAEVDGRRTYEFPTDAVSYGGVRRFVIDSGPWRQRPETVEVLAKDVRGRWRPYGRWSIWRKHPTRDSPPEVAVFLPIGPKEPKVSYRLQNVFPAPKTAPDLYVGISRGAQVIDMRLGGGIAYRWEGESKDPRQLVSDWESIRQNREDREAERDPVRLLSLGAIGLLSAAAGLTWYRKRQKEDRDV